MLSMIQKRLLRNLIRVLHSKSWQTLLKHTKRLDIGNKTKFSKALIECRMSIRTLDKWCLNHYLKTNLYSSKSIQKISWNICRIVSKLQLTMNGCELLNMAKGLIINWMDLVANCGLINMEVLAFGKDSFGTANSMALVDKSTFIIIRSMTII